MLILWENQLYYKIIRDSNVCNDILIAHMQNAIL